MQRVDEPELLDDRQRGAMPELHGAGADADLRGRGGRQREHDGGRGAGDAWTEVVFRDPVARVAPLLGVLGQVDAVAQRLRRAGPGTDRDEIEDREWCVRHGYSSAAGARDLAESVVARGFRARDRVRRVRDEGDGEKFHEATASRSTRSG